MALSKLACFPHDCSAVSGECLVEMLDCRARQGLVLRAGAADEGMQAQRNAVLLATGDVDGGSLVEAVKDGLRVGDRVPGAL